MENKAKEKTREEQKKKQSWKKKKPRLESHGMVLHCLGMVGVVLVRVRMRVGQLVRLVVRHAMDRHVHVCQHRLTDLQWVLVLLLVERRRLLGCLFLCALVATPCFPKFFEFYSR